MRTSIAVAVLLLLATGCAHRPLSPAALEETRLVAFIARIEDEAGPRSRVFRDDSSYRGVLAPRRIDDKEADRRLALALTSGSFEKTRSGERVIKARTISRFELADSLRSNTLALLPQAVPWKNVIHPVEVARVLESFLVQEVPANAPDYRRLLQLGADTVLEIVVEEYGMRSEKGRAGTYVRGFSRLFRIDGPELYFRRFVADDLASGLEPLDPFAAAKNAQLFAERMKQTAQAIAEQVAKDLQPVEALDAQPRGAGEPARPAGDQPAGEPASDDPL